MTFQQVGSIQDLQPPSSWRPSGLQFALLPSARMMQKNWEPATFTPYVHRHRQGVHIAFITHSLPEAPQTKGTVRQIGASNRVISPTWIDHLSPFLDPQDRNKVKCLSNNQSTNFLLTNHDWSPKPMRGSIATPCPSNPYTQYDFQSPRWLWSNCASFINVSLQIHTFLLPQKSMTLNHRIKCSKSKDHIIGSTVA